jgi:hypothetical protein
MTQRNEGDKQPRPTLEALQKLTLKNTSRPFDDAAALQHLKEVNPELVKADARLIDKMLS